MNILKLAAMLTLDGTRFKAGLKEAEAASNNFAKSVGESLKGEFAAAFGAGALIAFTKHSLQTVAGLKDLSEQSHMTTDEVQRATMAAEHMGLAFNDVAQAERQFNQNRREAAEGNEELIKVFERYGVTFADLQDPQFRFFDFLTRANKSMRDMSAAEMTRGLNDMADILGNRVGPKLQEFIKQLHEVRNLPIVNKKEIDDADAAMDKFKDITRGSGVSFVRSLMEPLAQSPTAQLARIYGEAAKIWFGGGDIDGSALPLPPGSRPPLFTGKPKTETAASAQRVADDIQKAQRELDTAMMTLGLGKRASVEAQLRENLRLVAATGRFGINGDPLENIRARTSGIGLLGQLMGMSGNRPDVAGLQRVGQLGGGRNFTSGDSELVKEARAILGVLRESKEIQTRIEQKRGKTINF